jgi:hypothetical protein
MWCLLISVLKVRMTFTVTVIDVKSVLTEGFLTLILYTECVVELSGLLWHCRKAKVLKGFQLTEAMMVSGRIQKN